MFSKKYININSDISQTQITKKKRTEKEIKKIKRYHISCKQNSFNPICKY